MIVRKEELVHTSWSGGTTTQLAIYPQDASYADRDFIWRVSTASVEAERSEFTPLPGVSRILMILEGSMRLIHDGSREVDLGRFGQDSFSGGSNTVSIGRARDFNLMTKEGCTGTIEALELMPDAHRLHTAQGVHDTDAFSDIGTEKATQLFYALTDARIDGRELAAGDVYIKNSGEKAHIETPAVIVRAAIIYEHE